MDFGLETGSGPGVYGEARKLKKVFIDMKVPACLRRTIPLLVKGEEILWVPGIRRGQGAPVLPGTRRVLEVSLVSESES